MNRVARIAIVQDDCIPGEKAQNIEKAAGLIKSAARQKAELVLFPEMYLTGYVLGDNIHQLAEAVSGPAIDALAQIAKTNQICICMGFPELDPDSRQIFNSLVCLSDRGDTLAVYRKIHHNRLAKARSSSVNYLRDRRPEIYQPLT